MIEVEFLVGGRICSMNAVSFFYMANLDGRSSSQCESCTSTKRTVICSFQGKSVDTNFDLAL